VEDNPDVLLPTNLDIEIGLQDSCEHEDSLNLEKLTTATRHSALWTEVVRRGRNRNKTKKC
jgi:hypothetical protein